MPLETAVRILLIEDETSIAAPLAEGLKRENFDVTVMRTGADGLAAAPGAELILLDLGLPDVDGADVCRLLRAQYDAPIIVLTARGDEHRPGSAARARRRRLRREAVRLSRARRAHRRGSPALARGRPARPTTTSKCKTSPVCASITELVA